jgi:hypothetical protein
MVSQITSINFTVIRPSLATSLQTFFTVFGFKALMYNFCALLSLSRHSNHSKTSSNAALFALTVSNTKYFRSLFSQVSNNTRYLFSASWQQRRIHLIRSTVTYQLTELELSAQSRAHQRTASVPELHILPHTTCYIIIILILIILIVIIINIIIIIIIIIMKSEGLDLVPVP